MGSLDQFLADLDDLNEEQQAEEGGGDELDDLDELDSGDDEDIDMLADDAQASGHAASGLLTSERMQTLMERIEEMMCSDTPVDPGSAEEAEVYGMIVQCNEMVIDVDNEIEAIAKTIRDEYAKRFPELESLILNPLDYARVVLKLGNETDLTQVDLTGILPSATVMVVTVTASTTVGTPLPDQTHAAVTEQCEQVLGLSDNKQQMLAFVESRMNSVAPNISGRRAGPRTARRPCVPSRARALSLTRPMSRAAIVGTTIAAKLVGAAGGLDKLAELPSTVVQILGSKKRALGGMGTSQVTHAGVMKDCDIVLNTPPGLRNKITRLVAGKVTLAARVDSHGAPRIA